MPIEAPRLETERLILRAHRVADFESTAALWADPDLVRHLNVKAFTREECWGRLIRYIGFWLALGFGFWVVEERATGAFVGEVGLARFEREITPSLGDAPEAGWMLHPSAHGKGYATEAMRAVFAWFDAEHPGTRVVCLIGEENAASMGVAEKLGFVEYARTIYKGDPVVLYERT